MLVSSLCYHENQADQAQNYLVSNKGTIVYSLFNNIFFKTHIKKFGLSSSGSCFTGWRVNQICPLHQPPPLNAAIQCFKGERINHQVNTSHKSGFRHPPSKMQQTNGFHETARHCNRKSHNVYKPQYQQTVSISIQNLLSIPCVNSQLDISLTVTLLDMMHW